jgi:hypothetical protein
MIPIIMPVFHPVYIGIIAHFIIGNPSDALRSVYRDWQF